jgi:hypothetical protein
MGQCWIAENGRYGFIWFYTKKSHPSGVVDMGHRCVFAIQSLVWDLSHIILHNLDKQECHSLHVDHVS